MGIWVDSSFFQQGRFVGERFVHKRGAFTTHLFVFCFSLFFQSGGQKGKVSLGKIHRAACVFLYNFYTKSETTISNNRNPKKKTPKKPKRLNLVV